MPVVTVKNCFTEGNTLQITAASLQLHCWALWTTIWCNSIISSCAYHLITVTTFALTICHSLNLSLQT